MCAHSILNKKPTIPPPSFIQHRVPLADKNWFKTGGPARFYAEPTTGELFAQALQFAHTVPMPLFILGHGANILIADEGFDGLVIRPHLKHIALIKEDSQHAYVSAQAGVSLDDLINFCLEHNLSGLEEFSGIPGTVGGAVYINLHYFEFLISHFLHNAEVIDKKTGIIQRVDSQWFNFGYNQSTLLDGNYYLVSATFKLKKITSLQAAYAQGRRAEIIRHRTARYPTSHTCGSFFRNFYPEEVTLISEGKKIIFIAYYLDKIGVKGHLSSGDAIVSHKHANMIVNRGNAKTSDIIQVARHMQELVKEHFNLLPQPECRLIGFKEYPLLKN